MRRSSCDYYVVGSKESEAWVNDMAQCKWWDGEACDKQAKPSSELCEMHTKMTPTSIGLEAGVIGAEQFKFYADGKVFRVDAQGQEHRVPEPLAERVRSAIKAGVLAGKDKAGRTSK